MQSITTAGRSSFWKILFCNIPIYASKCIGAFSTILAINWHSLPNNVTLL